MNRTQQSKTLEQRVKVWHRDVSWPSNEATTISLRPRSLTWTKHAMDRVYSKNLSVPMYLMQFEVVEVTETGKRTLRTSLGNGKDLVLVVENGVVITCWTNATTDNHGTLNRAIYEVG